MQAEYDEIVSSLQNFIGEFGQRNNLITPDEMVRMQNQINQLESTNRAIQRALTTANEISRVRV